MAPAQVARGIVHTSSSQSLIGSQGSKCHILSCPHGAHSPMDRAGLSRTCSRGCWQSSPSGCGDLPEDGRPGLSNAPRVFSAASPFFCPLRPLASPTGHVFNMPHDNVKVCEEVFGKLRANHMMSPTLIQIDRTHPWSACSAAIVTDFLDSGHGKRGLRGGPFILSLSFIYFFIFLPFLGLLPWHMEVPSLGVESEL